MLKFLWGWAVIRWLCPNVMCLELIKSHQKYKNWFWSKKLSFFRNLLIYFIICFFFLNSTPVKLNHLNQNLHSKHFNYKFEVSIYVYNIGGNGFNWIYLSLNEHLSFIKTPLIYVPPNKKRIKIIKIESKHNHYLIIPITICLQSLRELLFSTQICTTILPL